MSIIAENESGWLICHKTHLNQIYVDCLDFTDAKCHERKHFNLKCKADFFKINCSFRMDSCAQKEITDSNAGKKKRKYSMENSSNTYHNEIKEFIQNALSSLVQLGKECNYFDNRPLTCTERKDNNSVAKAAAKYFNQNSSLLAMKHSESEQKYIETDELDKVEKDVNGIIKYIRSIPGITSIFKNTYIIPNHSEFLLADITKLKTLVRISENLFDVILLDPPWFNKSVRRKKGYQMLTNDILNSLPVLQLASSVCLIIIWTTNNINQISYIKTELFPKWSVQHSVDWHWLKVTNRGSPIYELDSHHKKPYENLILGYINPDNKSVPKIPNHQVIVSVPSSIHSHKPPLTEILKPFIPESAKCLELFARYLLPGWTSCGDEVLKLQHLNLFEVSER